MSTKIEWTDETWNPIRGCSRVSEGCRHCYAERVAGRFSGPGQPYEGLIARGGQWNGQVRLVPEKLEEPLRWRKPRMIFVNSMSDLFHENVPDSFIDKVFAIMVESTWHTFQVLTKRPVRMLEYLTTHRRRETIDEAACDLALELPMPGEDYGWHGEWPAPNIWLGVSVEDQATADERIPLLLQTPAAVRWVSAEPLLGPVDLSSHQVCSECCQSPYQLFSGDPLCENPSKHYDGFQCPLHWWPASGCDGVVKHQIDWLVAGGESGFGARPAHPDWFRSLRDQCQAAGVAFHFKQWGEYLDVPRLGFPHHLVNRAGGEICDADNVAVWRWGKKRAGRELDGRTWDQYPEVPTP